MKKNHRYFVIVTSIFIIFFVVLYNSLSYGKFPNMEMKHGRATLPVVKFLRAKNIPLSTNEIFFYKNRQIGFNGYIDGDIFIAVTYLGKIEKKLTIQQVQRFDNNFTEIFPLGSIMDPARYLNINALPFKITDIAYFVRGTVVRKIEHENFKEIIFHGDLINFSFDKRRRDFGFLFKKDTVSVSLLEIDKELYIIHGQSDRFKSTSLSELLAKK